jgi:holo-[acyl-carrier protein] synthase
MIIGIGCDIIEINRVEKAVQSESFKKRVFTEAEIAYCESRGKQQFASFAARFAAKEAVLKAFGTGLRGGELVEIEVLNDELGCPQLSLRGYHEELAHSKGVGKIHVTLSHSKDSAMAYVVLEG